MGSKFEDADTLATPNKRASTRKTKSEDEEKDKAEDSSLGASSSKRAEPVTHEADNHTDDIQIDNDIDDDLNKLFCCQNQEKIFGLKVSDLSSFGVKLINQPLRC